MPRETALRRGVRLLTQGRLVVAWVDRESIRARCRGDSGEMRALGFDSDRGWWCGCPARARCAHLVAVQLVVLTPLVGMRDPFRGLVEERS